VRRIATLLALGLAVGACTTSEDGYARLQRAVKNPDIGREAHSECTEIVGMKSQKVRKQLAEAIGVSPAMAPSIYCKRVFDGVTSGRLTRADWDSLDSGRPTENLIRVVRGRG